MHTDDIPWDIVRETATTLVREYGERAIGVAKHRALKARASGEPGEAEVWQAVARVTAQVLTSEVEA
jgi:hypothetical protein